MSHNHNPHDKRVLAFYPTIFICVFISGSILDLTDPTTSKGPFFSWTGSGELHIYEKTGYGLVV